MTLRATLDFQKIYEAKKEGMEATVQRANLDKGFNRKLPTVREEPRPQCLKIKLKTGMTEMIGKTQFLNTSSCNKNSNSSKERAITK